MILEQLSAKINELQHCLKQEKDKFLKSSIRKEIQQMKHQLKIQAALQKEKQRKIKYRSGPIHLSCTRNFLPLLKFVCHYFDQYSKTLLKSDSASAPRDLSVVLCFGDTFEEYEVVSSFNFFKNRLNDEIKDWKRLIKKMAKRKDVVNRLNNKIAIAQHELEQLLDQNRNKSERYSTKSEKARRLCSDRYFQKDFDSCLELEEREANQFINHEPWDPYSLDECYNELFEDNDGYGIVVVDYLGLYRTYTHNKFNGKEDDYKKGKIVLFCDKIFEVANTHGVDGHALFEKVLVHELAHAYHHLGFDENHNGNDVFSALTGNILEGYANYMAWHYINVFLMSFQDIKKTSRYKFAMTDPEMLNEAFLNATKQTGRYGVYKGFVSRNYSMGLVNKVNSSYREMASQALPGYDDRKKLFSLDDFVSRAERFNQI
jgi:hypothetical protein